MSHISRILVIEDESGIALALYKSLTQASYRVVTAKTGSSGLHKASARQFDVVILDLGLPDMSGLSVCRRLRDDGLETPIIILTGENSVKVKVSLFDAGANDYLTKPFSLDELHARIRTCLRPAFKASGQQLIAGELTLHADNHTVVRDGRSIPLRRKEFAILECLMQHSGSVVSRASLMNYAWDGGEDSWTNTVDVHIKHLRDKIDRPFTHPLIKTVHGLGYKLDAYNSVAEIQ